MSIGYIIYQPHILNIIVQQVHCYWLNEKEANLEHHKLPTQCFSLRCAVFKVAFYA
jgi:hypothetical protein